MVATILKGAASNYPPSARAKIPLHDGWGTVISLNFDHAWLPADAKDDTAEVTKSWEGPHHLLKREFDRLTVNRQFSTTQDSSKRRVWFPNGIHSMPHTIRMGIDDYGAAPHAIQVAYNRLKQWEQQSSTSVQSPEAQFQNCAAALLSEHLGEPTFPLSWVAEFLYRPIIFAGVGLSDQEIGLWWLLSKRARNMARVHAQNHVYILLDAKASKDAWSHNAFGITPIYCDNWDAGWARVVKKAEELNIGL